LMLGLSVEKICLFKCVVTATLVHRITLYAGERVLAGSRQSRWNYTVFCRLRVRISTLGLGLTREM
jgi:hypothetical protein